MKGNIAGRYARLETTSQFRWVGSWSTTYRCDHEEGACEGTIIYRSLGDNIYTASKNVEGRPQQNMLACNDRCYTTLAPYVTVEFSYLL